MTEQFWLGFKEKSLRVKLILIVHKQTNKQTKQQQQKPEVWSVIRGSIVLLTPAWGGVAFSSLARVWGKCSTIYSPTTYKKKLYGD